MQLKKALFYSLTIGVTAISISGCGNRQGQIDSIHSSSLDVIVKGVTLPSIRKEDAGEHFSISIKNTGTSDSEAIATLVNTPPRIHFLGEKATGIRCIGSLTDATCGPSLTCIGGNCISYSDSKQKLIKVSKGNEPTSFLVGIIGGAQDLKCPTAPGDVPDEYKVDYCGQIDVTYRNVGKKETKTVYLQYKGSHGVAKLNTQAIRIDGTIFGRRKEKKLILENSGENPLVVSNIALKENNSSFGVKTDKGYDFTLQPGERVTITISFLPDAPSANTEIKRNTLEILFTILGPKKIEIPITALSTITDALFAPIEETMLAFNSSMIPKEFQLVNSSPSDKKRLYIKVTSSPANQNTSTDSYKIAQTQDGEYTQKLERILIDGGETNNSASLFIKATSSSPHKGTLFIQSDDPAHPTEEIILTDGSMQPYGRSYPRQLSLTKENQSFHVLVRNMGGKSLTLNGYTCSQCVGGDSAITFDTTTPAPTSNTTIDIPPFSYHLFKINIPHRDRIGSSNPKLVFTAKGDLSTEFTSDNARLEEGISLINTSATETPTEAFTIEGPITPLNIPTRFPFYIHTNNTTENETCEWYFSSSPTFANTSTARPFLVRSQPCQEGLILNPQIPGDYLLFAIRAGTETSAELPFTITVPPTSP